MFVKLDKAEVLSVSTRNTRDDPIGDVYINTKYISHIDGFVVVVRDFCICCSETGIEKVLYALEME